MENDLILNIDKLHTTSMGVDRIKRNLQISCDDVVQYCHDIIMSSDALIDRNGKNWYIYFGNITITVNAHSYTIITAHKNKK